MASRSEEGAEVIVRRMMAAMARRGPDEEGLLLTSSASVGMRRLNIIDLRGGSQPAWNEDCTLAVVYNGEIYNFRELREDLERAGHIFRSHSDTEVVVHAYEAWGEDCVKRFRGMFAFAAIEMPQGSNGAATRVFLARDPLGIKPLYYTTVDGALFFASEVRALLASQVVPARLSTDALRSYLLFGSVSEPVTLVEGVFSLPPGHFMSISATRPVANPETKSYWNASGLFRERSEMSSPEQTSLPAERVRTLLENSVRCHFIADVPIGVFLSSGLDSTAVATLASGHQADLHTLTVAFPDMEFSESEQARRTAARLHTNHSELTLTGPEMLRRLDEAIAAFDQPSMDGINTYFVSWAAREAGLKVALSGLGSDELFGGYTSFRDTSIVAKVAAIAGICPRPIRAWAATSFDGSPSFRRFPRRFPKSPGCVVRSFIITRRIFLYADAVHSPESRRSFGRKVQRLAGLALVEVAVRGR